MKRYDRVITFKIDSKTWEKFRQKCIKRFQKPSERLRELIKIDLEMEKVKSD